MFWQGKGCPPNYLAFNSLILPTLFFFSFSFESYLFCTQRTLRERIASPFTIDYLSRILFHQIEICFNSTTWHIFSLLHGSFQKFTDFLPSLIYCWGMSECNELFLFPQIKVQYAFTMQEVEFLTWFMMAVFNFPVIGHLGVLRVLSVLFMCAYFVS